MCLYLYWNIFDDLFLMNMFASMTTATATFRPIVIPLVLVNGGFSTFSGIGATSSVFGRVRGRKSSSGRERVDREPSLLKNLGSVKGWRGIARISE